MSAITGFWNFDGSPQAAALCRRSLEAQEMYGPDDAQLWCEGGTAIGRRLARFLPEDTYDQQPLSVAGGRVLVADVRLDNRDELMGHLGLSIEDAQAMSDAAIVAACVDRWDQSCFQHLVGDYAIAWWDAARLRFILGRDPVGNRPLHYYRGPRFFAFASMPKGLHAIPEVPYAPDEDAAAEFLAVLPEDGERSFFKDIKRIPSGHFAVVTADSVTLYRHWQPSRRKLMLRGFDEYAEGLRHHLELAVRSRLRGAVNVGAHLSSGLDSSSVAATAARILQTTGGKVVAFTSAPREGFISRRNGIVDESARAAATVALHSNMEHVVVRSEGRTPGDDIDRNFHVYERPVFGLCSQVWLHTIHDAMTARGLRVLLTGEMGNFTLSYNGSELLPELFRAGRWLVLAREITAFVRNRQLRLRGAAAQTIGPFVPQFLWQWASRFAGNDDPRLEAYAVLNSAAAARIRQRARAMGYDLSYRPAADAFETRLRMIQFSDPANYRMGALAGWGIDVRDPTDDRRLIEFCLSVPVEYFRYGGVARALVRRAMADRLPDVVLKERAKGFQTADWYERLTAARARLNEEVELFAACDAAQRILDVARMQKMFRDWPADGSDKVATMIPYRNALLRGISVGHFLRSVAAGRSRT